MCACVHACVYVCVCVCVARYIVASCGEGFTLLHDLGAKAKHIRAEEVERLR